MLTEPGDTGDLRAQGHTQREIAATLKRVAELLVQGTPQAALEVLDGCQEETLELENARAVCLLRAGDPARAQRILGAEVLDPHSRQLRDDLPPPVLVNYLTAALLAEGDLAYCESELKDVQDCAAARALRKAIDDWRSGLTPWQRFGRAVLGNRVKDFRLGFELGVLVGVSEQDVVESPDN